MSLEVDDRPLLRGWSHTLCVLPAAGGAAVLVASARGDVVKQVSLGVYGTALTLLFAVSALYHRFRWSARVRSALRRVDHADISLLIAATYTPIAAVLLDGAPRVLLLCAVWTAALSGAVIAVFGIPLRRGALVALYVVTGWVALLVLPALFTRVGATGMVLLCGGGLLYTVGAVAYATQRPRLWPRVFGYHEVFHLFVIAASALFFGFMAFAVVPARL